MLYASNVVSERPTAAVPSPGALDAAGAAPICDVALPVAVELHKAENVGLINDTCSDVYTCPQHGFRQS